MVYTRDILDGILEGRNRKNIQQCAPDLMATSTPPHTPRTPGSEPGYGPARPSDHSPFDPLRERRPPAFPYGDPGLVTVGALTSQLCPIHIVCRGGILIESPSKGRADLFV